MAGPAHQPLPNTGLTRACRVDRLRPGDVVYGPPDLADAQAAGYTVTSVDLSTCPATIGTRKQCRCGSRPGSC